MRLSASLVSFALLIFTAFSSAFAAGPLPVNEAFRLGVTKDADGRLVLGWTIAEGYYLYRDHIAAKDDKGNALDVGTQPGIAKDDPNFGRLEVYYRHASASLNAQAAPVEITYQGCQEDGICYRPETRTVDPVTLAVSSQMGTLAKAQTQSFAQGTAFTTAAPRMAASTANESKAFALAPEKGMVENLLAEGGTCWPSRLAFSRSIPSSPERWRARVKS
jgi:thiol:disulfide interchange protein DsbD